MSPCALCGDVVPTTRTSGLDVCGSCLVEDPTDALGRQGMAAEFSTFGMRFSAQLFVPGQPEDFRLTASPERIQHKLFKLFAAEVQVGDPIFDDRIYVRTSDHERAAVVLASEGVQSAILVLLSDVRADDLISNHITLDGTALKVRSNPRRGLGEEQVQLMKLETAVLGLHLRGRRPVLG